MYMRRSCLFLHLIAVPSGSQLAGSGALPSAARAHRGARPVCGRRRQGDGGQGRGRTALQLRDRPQPHAARLRPEAEPVPVSPQGQREEVRTLCVMQSSVGMYSI